MVDFGAYVRGYHLTGPAKHRIVYLLYLSRNLSPDSGLNLASVPQNLAQFSIMIQNFEGILII